MKVKRQPIIETDEVLQIRLREPYWGAWKQYGWRERVEGFGLSKELVEMAVEKKKRIEVSFKYGRYRITGTKAKRYFEKYNSEFKARDKTTLWVIPRTAFTRQKPILDQQEKREKLEQERRKLGQVKMDLTN